MAFGRPTRYLQLDLNRVPTAPNSNNVRSIWDKSVEQASDEYKKRMVINQFFFVLSLYNFLSSITCVVTIVILMSLWH
jgi:hypothetical protein